VVGGPPAGRAAQRPEQLLFQLRIAVDEAPVGEDDQRADQRVARESVRPAEHAEPAAQCEPGDTDRRAVTSRNGPPALMQPS
jgi:hypothetical protein